MAYTLPAWANSPSATTPLSAANLLLLNTAINDLDTRALIYNVKAYGAAGNGTTDDYTAIQAALSAAGVAGGAVYLPGATYATTKCLNVPSNVTVFGDGMGVTTVKAISGLLTGTNGGINGGYSVFEQSGTATVNIALRDLTVNANYAVVGVVSGSVNRQNAGIVDFRGITGLTFERVEVKNGWFYHLATWTCSNVVVRDCVVTGPGTSGTYDQLDGIHLEGTSTSVVAGNRVNMGAGTDGDDGIALHIFPASGDTISDVAVTGNVVRGGANGAGIDLANADSTIKGVSITGNVIHDCVGKAIVTNWFGAFTGTTKDVTIAGNTVRDCGGPIVVGDISGNNAPYTDFTIAGNQITASGGQAYQQSTTNASNIAIDRTMLPLVTQSYAATLNTDVSSGCRFRVTLTGNVTLANPTGATIDGQRVTWEFIQDGTGSRTLTLGAAFALGTTITSTTLTTAASKRDYLTAVYDQAALKWYVVEFVKGY